MKIEHNLEYLLTRPGALKATTVIVGLVASTLCSHSYGDSPYTDHYEAEMGRNDSDNHPLPGTELELSNMTITFIILGISVIYLASHALFYVICESRLNKFIDTAFHMCGALFLFTGGASLIYSAVNIERNGCPLYLSGHRITYFSPVAAIVSAFRRNPWNGHQMNSVVEPHCHYFGEKIVGACLNMVNAVLYAVLGFVIFTTDVEEI